MKRVELRIKIKLGEPFQIEEIIKMIKRIEKEYSCNCTLLEVEID